MSRDVVDASGVRRVLTGRRTELEHQLTHVPGDAELTETRLAELTEVERRLEAHLADHGTEDPTRTTRPGVLLIGAGVRGDLTVRADLEALDLAHLSDRDLAIYTALTHYVTERLEQEADRRRAGILPRLMEAATYGHRPAGWVLGTPADGGQDRVA